MLRIRWVRVIEVRIPHGAKVPMVHFQLAKVVTAINACVSMFMSCHASTRFATRGPRLQWFIHASTIANWPQSCDVDCKHACASTASMHVHIVYTYIHVHGMYQPFSMCSMTDFNVQPKACQFSQREKGGRTAIATKSPCRRCSICTCCRAAQMAESSESGFGAIKSSQALML